MLLVLLAWTTFLFGGVYASTLVVPGILVLLLAWSYRPWVSRGGYPSIEIAMAGALAAGVFQIVPLPSAIVDALSPHARGVAARLSFATGGALPLTADLASSVEALLVGAGIAIVFLSALRIFVTGGVRQVVRGVSAIGLVLSAVAIAQDATAHGLMYWRWAPLEEGAPPFGPFVNRNHFATWVILAVPLCLGYLAAHTDAHHHEMRPGLPWRRRLMLSLDARAMWLCAAVALMVVAQLVSLSRSGFTGLVVALLTGAWMRRRAARTARPASAWLIGGLALAALLAVARVDPAAIGGRVATLRTSTVDRVAIWRETLPMVRDFWLTGTGAGTYETAMLVYQRPPVIVRYNQAHNQYLQLAAEGGLLLCLPLAAVMAAWFAAARRAMQHDGSGMYWIRAGAACGLAGVAAQSIWETGLSTPANALMAALAAAVVIHNPGHSRPGR